VTDHKYPDTHDSILSSVDSTKLSAHSAETPRWLSQYSDGLLAGWQGFHFQYEQDMCLCPTVLRSALGLFPISAKLTIHFRLKPRPRMTAILALRTVITGSSSLSTSLSKTRTLPRFGRNPHAGSSMYV
jgi:hypothetical protein